MNFRTCLLFMCFFKSFSVFCQHTDTVKIFYNINECKLSNSNKAKLDSLYDLFDHQNPLIVVRGFADYLGNKKSNYLLSWQRAETVKQYLLASNRNLFITTEGKGQIIAYDKVNKNGEPLNRRVEIIINRVSASAREENNNPLPIKNSPLVKLINDSVGVAETKFGQKVNSLSNLDIGGSLNLEELTFEPGRHYLDPQSLSYLKTLTQYLAANKNITFEIRGHICCDYQHSDGYDFDTKTYNLSVNRAREIHQYLLKNGIDSNRMRYIGVGNTQPKVYPEITLIDQQLNRRVEIVVTGK